MDSGKHEISHVSDTALMVAAARALETQRPDGLVHDPLAGRLAGERGVALLHGLPWGAALTFGVGMRSRFLDQLLLGVLDEGAIDTVLILGAGLDTRPWRLQLPPGLRWIEVDFEDMLDYKSARLTEAPHCRLERRAADLNDPAARDALFAEAGERTLLITEGLLMYLPAGTIEGIADGAARAGLVRWLMDASSPELSRRVGMRNCQSIENVRAADSLNGLEILDVLRARGWRDLRFLSYTRDSMASAPERITAMVRELMASGAPPPEPPPPDDPSGVHLLAR